MKKLLWILILGSMTSIRLYGQTNQPAGPVVETIICIRHGEKPPDGLGQLNCRGLNRALALPDVLLGKYGTPQFIFAPNPAEKVEDHGGAFNYIRPLMTIEPTAIRCGLPVNTRFGFLEIKGLERELQKQTYNGATVFVAWEHVLVDKFVKDLVADNGGASKNVPDWPKDDFDSIFVIKITHIDTGASVAFTIDHEGLNSLSDTCPSGNPGK